MADVETLTQVGPLAINLLVLVVMGLQSYLGNPTDKYLDRAKEIQSTRWSAVSNELGLLFVDIQESYPPEQYSEKDIPMDAKYALFIQETYNGGDIEDLRDSINHFNKPRYMYKNLKNSYKSAIRSFVISFLSATGITGTVFFIQNILSFILLGVFIGTFIAFGIIGTVDLIKYRDMKERINEEYESEYLY